MTSQIDGTSDETSSASEDLPGSATTASNLLCAVAPTNPTSIPDIIAALRGIDALHGLADHEYHWLASHGSERVAEDRVIVFREGEPAHHLNIILKGEIYVHRRNSGSISLFIGRTGQITGKLREAPVLPDDVLGRRGFQLRLPLDTRFPR
jgi:CRP-like cAMP-binding protein